MYSEFTLKNNQVLCAKVEFVIKEDEENGFIPLKTIVFDKFSSSLLIKIFPQKIKSLFDANEYLFSKDYEFYNDNLQKFCKEINLSLKDIKNAICFEYQLNNLYS